MTARIQDGGRARRPSRLRRRAFAGALILLAALWFGASPVAAAGETPGACVAEKVEALNFGGRHGGEALAILKETAATGVDVGAEDKLKSFEKKLEGCLEAPNPIIPEVTEIIWGGIAFVVLFALMQWKLFPAVKRGMDRRAEKIRDDLDAAETARTEALEVKAGYEAELADARAEAGRIVDAARADAEQVRAELIARAETEADELRQRSDLDVEAAKRQALADLQSEVEAIVIGAAETVIGRNLDHDTQVQLIESYIDDVGSQN
ncbi:MAG: F0F1 ATP synthase subunit B [bacterium]|nr:F0F1 ATP synthase subunit B [bacterium]MXV90161.1 F0F1 ATP synthase subunit B [Acidimicrobiia bacterium]MYC45010.1 F0F1 ATP synthase subunit B [Acidimicrobiia bacterium]MYI20496.1 F0F1 ATP synthase subunit B [Acidimicrobiia bacterium]